MRRFVFALFACLTIGLSFSPLATAAPHAYGKATPNPVVVGHPVTLYDWGSFDDANGQIVQWQWDVTDDGVWDYNGATVQHTFTQPGRFPVKLRVTNNAEPPQTHAHEFWVYVKETPIPPIADAGQSYLFCPQQTPWQLNASNSWNPDEGLSEAGAPGDTVVSHLWDLDGNGQFADASGITPDVSGYYSGLLGNYVAWLRVQDNAASSFPSTGTPNLTDTTFANVFVRSATDSACTCVPDLRVLADTQASTIDLHFAFGYADHYEVLRATSAAGPFSHIGDAVFEWSEYTHFTDTAVVPGQMYYYYVRHINYQQVASCQSVMVSARLDTGSANPVPSIVSTPVIQAEADAEYRYRVQAFAEGVAPSLFRYELRVAPTGMQIDALTGQITWTPSDAQEPTYSQSGQHAVHVVAKYADSPSDSQAASQVFNIQVNAIHNPPTIVSTPLVQAYVDEHYHYDVLVYDTDTWEYQHYTLLEAPAGMTIDFYTGQIHWRPTTADIGNHVVSIQVYDYYDLGTTQTYTLNVIARDPNGHAPVITSTPVTQTDDEALYHYDVNATDADSGEVLNYALLQAPAGMSINATTGLIHWTPALGLLDGQSQAFAVQLRVTDTQGHNVEQSYTLTVHGINRAPQFTSTPVLTVQAGNAYSYALSASDPDQDPVSFSLTQSPTGMTLNTDTVQWTPALNHVGQHLITLTAHDGHGHSVTQSYTLTVTPPPQPTNHAPVITSEPNIHALAQTAYQYDVNATDADGDTLSYHLSFGPQGMTINSQTGLIQWQPTRQHVGDLNIGVLVQDSHGAVDVQTYVLHVARDNAAPVFNSTPEFEVHAEQTYRYTIKVTDPDDDAFTLSLAQAPSGMVIVGNKLAWQTDAADIGTHAVVIHATDALGAQTQQSFTLTVTEVNQAPSITSTPNVEAVEGQGYQYAVSATDPNVNDTLSYSLLSAPFGMAIQHTTGQINGLPGADVVSDNTRALTACKKLPAVGSFNPVLKWHWQGSEVLPDYNQVMSTPMVAQTNDDNGDGQINAADYPDLIFVAFSKNDVDPDRGPGVLRIVSGKDGSTLNTLTNTAYRLRAFGNVAVGDMDGDGLIEIIGPKHNGGLIAFNHDGSLAWSMANLPGLPTRLFAGISIADLEGDGVVEIIQSSCVVSNLGTLKWCGQNGYLGSNNGVHVDASSVVADINGDGIQDIIAGASAFNGLNGTLLWKNTTVGEGLNGIANLLGDAHPEIVVARDAKVWLLSHTGVKLWGPVTLPSDSNVGGGVPTIADFNGDGAPEIGIAGQLGYTVISAQGTVLWSKLTEDQSSITGSTAFDFEGDGKMEVLYNDEYFFRIYRGNDGTELLKMVNSSGTSLEYPVVVDLENDNHAEILLVSNNYLNQSTGTYGIKVFSDANNSWMGTRGLWNQANYVINNVNDDGTIPAHPIKSWQTHNTFRLNTFPDRSPLDQADLNVTALRLLNNAQQLHATVNNVGQAPSHPSLNVVFYADAIDDAHKLGETTLSTLNPSASNTVTLNLNAPLPSNTQVIYARVDVDNRTDECNENNNQTRSWVVSVRAQDPDNAQASQRYAVHVADVNQAPVIGSTPLTHAITGIAYQYAIAATDADPGEQLRYVLTQAPSGMTLGQDNVLRWTPAATETGSFTISLQVTDTGGLSATQTYTLAVSTPANNQAPVITSQAPTTGHVGTLYHYDIEAIDADHDPIAYALISAPQGLTMNVNNGLVQWTPTPAQLGQHSVTVSATDVFGAQSTQSFTVSVGAHQNQAPTISSTPVTTAVANTAYNYTVTATDPDAGDVLTYVLTQKPSGMSINAQAGVISWTPTTQHVGQHNVTVRVTDSQGAQATQSYTVTVTAQPVDTTPPAITLTATPDRVNPGESSTVNVSASDNVAVTQLTVTLDGNPITLTNSQYLFTGVEPSHHVFVATAQDAAGNISTQTLSVDVKDPNDTSPPQVSLSSPTDDSELTDRVNVVGSVSDQNLAEYTLSYTLIGTGNTVAFAHGTATVSNDVLGTFDPTLLSNGLYRIRLSARDVNGKTASAEVGVLVRGELKLGTYQFSLADLNVPYAGLPLAIERTYDSTRAAEDLDFGKGWASPRQLIRVQENRVPGVEWGIDLSGSFLEKKKCYTPRKPHRVVVTLPNGQMERFRMKTEPECRSVFDLENHVTVIFEPESKTFSQLALVGPDTALAAGNGLFDPGSGLPIDPDHYRLTTADGYVYDLDQSFGVKRITDPRGHWVQYSPAGVVHSNGQSVAYEHDSAGRISGFVDLLGHHISYHYDAQGRLIASTDAAHQTTQFGYNSQHRLTTITDSSQRTVTQQYDSAGRLIKSIDPAGSFNQFAYDLSAHSVTLTDARGFTRTLEYDAQGHVLSDTDALGNTTQYAYDADGNEISVTDALGNTVTRTHDTYGNILTETLPDGQTITRTWSGASQRLLTETQANGGLTTRQYSPQGDLLSVTDALGQTTHFSYHALSGQLSGVQDALGHSTHYQYNNLGFKTADIDALGHRTDYTHDAHGNVLTETRTRTQADGSTETLVTENTYDKENRLTQVTKGADVTQYKYNDHGIRIASVHNGVETKYTVDTNRDYAQVLEERTNNTTVASYIHGSDYSQGIISQTRNSQTNTYLKDALGSVTGLANSQGNLTDTYSYSAYGETKQHSGTTTNNYLFAGEAFNPESNLYYNRARYYNPGIGRFINMDTWVGKQERPQSLNKYSYTESNPVNATDPTGYFMSLTEVGVSQQISSILTLVVVAHTVPYTYQVMHKISYAQARINIENCARNQRVDCDNGPIPYVVYGRDVADVADHIYDAITTQGKSAVLRKAPSENSRGWLASDSRCKGLTGGTTGKECDEYPFASAVEGGKANRPSLLPVDAIHNKSAGAKLGGFGGVYSCPGLEAGVPQRDEFGVIPISFWVGKSFVVCGK